jgi:release factor glutamine methyltransferase
MNLENTIKKASQILKNHDISSYELDAELLLSYIMGVKKEFLILNNTTDISEEIKKKYKIAIKRRINREPVAYITGKKEFWSKNFFVNKSTLVPRPETELLIYKLIKFYKFKKINILDIGTGSGCILLSLLKELNHSYGTGIDISKKAIEIAKKNAKNLELNNRSKFRVFDLEKFNIGKYDLIVSNPPYIPTKNINKLSLDIINHEPKNALDGGLDGLDFFKKVIYMSNNLLKLRGLLALEIGFNQHLKVSRLLKLYKFREIHKEYDFKQNVRCIISTKEGFF